MGTRSTTQVRVNGEPLLTFYRQFDGYPAGHGKDMLPLLEREHVNGYNNASKQYNGPSNFAAMLIALLFEGRHRESPGVMDCGGIYIRAHEDHGKEEFGYTIDFAALDSKLGAKEPPKITVTGTDTPSAWRGMSVEEFKYKIHLMPYGRLEEEDES